MNGVKIGLQTPAVVVVEVRPAGAIFVLVALAQALVRVPLLDVALLEALGAVVRVRAVAAAVLRVVPLQRVAVFLLDAALARAAQVLLDEDRFAVLEADLGATGVLEDGDFEGNCPGRGRVARKPRRYTTSATALNSGALR